MIGPNLDQLPKIGTDSCNKGYWMGVVQGPKLKNGSYEWLEDKPPNQQKHYGQSFLETHWAIGQPNGKEFQQCVCIDTRDINMGKYYWKDTECEGGYR